MEAVLKSLVQQVGVSDIDAVENRRLFGATSGAMEALVRVVATHGNSCLVVAELGLVAVSNLVLNNAENNVRLGDCGACQVVISTLKNIAITNPNAAELGLWAVANLAANSVNRVRLGICGACEVVTNVLRSSATTHAGVAEHGLAAIANLAVDDANTVKLGACDTCEVLSVILEFYMSKIPVNQTIARQCSWAILSTVNGNAANISKARALGLKSKLNTLVVNNEFVTDTVAKTKAARAAASLGTTASIRATCFGRLFNNLF